MPKVNSRKNHKSCDVVADFFLVQLNQNSGDSITNLKLQKLCYYAQAWCLVLLNKPVFDEHIEAWAHGPVVPSLYRRFKEYKWESIDPTNIKTDPYNELEKNEIDVLLGVWAKYGGYNGTYLEDLTHNELPWKKAYSGTNKNKRCTNKITQSDMKIYFKELMDVYEQHTRSTSTSGSTAVNIEGQL